MNKYKISITNYNKLGYPVSGVSRVISDLTFSKIRKLDIKEIQVMAKMQKFVTQTDWLWYTAELTDEQVAEYKAYENDETGELDEPFSYFYEKILSKEYSYNK